MSLNWAWHSVMLKTRQQQEKMAPSGVCQVSQMCYIFTQNSTLFTHNGLTLAKAWNKVRHSICSYIFINNHSPLSIWNFCNCRINETVLPREPAMSLLVPTIYRDSVIPYVYSLSLKMAELSMYDPPFSSIHNPYYKATIGLSSLGVNSVRWCFFMQPHSHD